MQYGTLRSVALALAQTALGPSERLAAVCWLLSAKWGQFALGVFLRLWGMQRLAFREQDLNTDGRRELNVAVRGEFMATR